MKKNLMLLAVCMLAAAMVCSLAIAKKEMEEKKMQLHLEEVNLEALINDVSDHFRADAEERAIGLGFFQEEPILSVPLDSGLMKRVFANLMNNALRHTPKGGKIEVQVSFAPGKKHILAAVRDNGRGLPPEYHQKIFDKFEQVRLKSEKSFVGSCGLGLTFCKMAVEAHGGKIWVESEGEGKGCTFWIEIPLPPGSPT